MASWTMFFGLAYYFSMLLHRVLAADLCSFSISGARVTGNNFCNGMSSLSRLIKTHIYKSASNYYTQKHLVPLTNFRQKGLCLPC